MMYCIVPSHSAYVSKGDEKFRQVTKFEQNKKLTEDLERMQDVGAFVWKKPGCRKRLICVSPELQAHVWPFTFSLFMRAARPLCQWASRNGVKMHPSLRVVSRGHKGLGVVTLRSLPQDTPVMSIPLRLALASSNEDRQTLFLSSSSPLEQLSHMFVRGLVDPTCPWKTYLEFLHDSHNVELEEDALLNSDVALSDAVDEVMNGNALVMSGVPNAPFLSKKLLCKARHRVQWVRWQQARRELEQAVPHYAAQAAPWAISMVLSRSIPSPEECCDSGAQEHMVVPLLDMINHSDRTTANAKRVFTFPKTSRYGGIKESQPQCDGVLHFDQTVPHVHVVTTRQVNAGRELTMCYSENDDPEYWLLHWGFVPTELKGVGLKQAHHSAPRGK